MASVYLDHSYYAFHGSRLIIIAFRGIPRIHIHVQSRENTTFPHVFIFLGCTLNPSLILDLILHSVPHQYSVYLIHIVLTSSIMVLYVISK